MQDRRVQFPIASILEIREFRESVCLAEGRAFAIVVRVGLPLASYPPTGSSAAKGEIFGGRFFLVYMNCWVFSAGCARI